MLRARQQRLLRCPAAMRAIERTRRDSVVCRGRCSAYPWMTPVPDAQASFRLLLAASVAWGQVCWPVRAGWGHYTGEGRVRSRFVRGERAGSARFVWGHFVPALDERVVAC